MALIESFSGLPFGRTQTLREIASRATGKYLLLYTGNHHLEMGMFACERIVGIAEDMCADMLYADHYRLLDEGIRLRHPLIECQTGALRDDFDFGSVLVFKSSSFKRAVIAPTAFKSPAVTGLSS